MRISALISVLILSNTLLAQQKPVNLQHGYIAEGYDVTAYFSQKAIEGKTIFTYSYQGGKYKFFSQANLEKFKANPERYVPQYGGFCAYAMGRNGEKVQIDPETFEIRDGKLYLFYNSFFNNTLESWTVEGPEKLRIQADKNWLKIN